MSDPSEKATEIKPDRPRRRINGLVIIALALLFLVVATYRSEVHKIYCDDEILASKPDVVMLGAWWCPYCYKARAYLQDSGISYCEYDMEHSAAGKKLYEETGAMSIPVLMIGKYVLQGFDQSSIDRALELSRERNGDSD